MCGVPFVWGGSNCVLAFKRVVEQNQVDETFPTICARLLGTDLNANLKCLSIYNLIPVEISAAPPRKSFKTNKYIETV